MPHELDKEDMEGIIRHSPDQFLAGWEAALEHPQLPGPLTTAVVAGMGGSWMPAALAADAGLVETPVRIHRGYDLPAGLDRAGTLVVAYSFSGNTEETLSAYEVAREAGLAVVGVAKGGKLQERCQEDRTCFIRIPANPPHIQPRSATNYGVGILLHVLARCGRVIPGAKATLENLAAFLKDNMHRAREAARELLPKLKDASRGVDAAPVVYAPARYATVARICKIKFNENAKTPAFWNVLPELNHNEMTGWLHHAERFHLVVLSDPDEDPRIRLREEVTMDLLAKHGLASTQIAMQGRNLAEKMFFALLVGDWASYELALALGIDPTPVDLVEDFKRELQRRRGE